MKQILPVSQAMPDLPRRKFVQGLAAGGVLLGLAPLVRPAWGELPTGNTATGTAPILSGTEFDLVIEETAVNFTGSPAMATTVNGSLPAPTLRWREGETVTIRVTNRMPVSTSIHWHGIILPYQMDGVPGVSFAGIAPGETFVYRFQVNQSGTYWYHSHSGFQEQTGLYGAIIVEPAAGNTIRADRDYVVQLSDWTDKSRATTSTSMSQPSLIFSADISAYGYSYGYTYLMNGMTPAGNWTGLFRPGERVRLRFISAGTQSYFDVRIPGLKMTVIHVDGQDVEPVTVDGAGTSRQQ